MVHAPLGTRGLWPRACSPDVRGPGRGPACSLSVLLVRGSSEYLSVCPCSQRPAWRVCHDLGLLSLHVKALVGKLCPSVPVETNFISSACVDHKTGWPVRDQERCCSDRGGLAGSREDEVWEGSAQGWGQLVGETSEKQNGGQAKPVLVFCAPGLTPVPSGQGRTWGGEPITLAAGELVTCSGR